jgi:hypothetical protein|tara:strand:- start:730 stop:1437 length:708 start_codon:yes stop_codon:yes gene_type:complete
MSLPKLNNVPKYKLNIPSTKKEITFRPFLVKEEKILLIALESQDPIQITTAITDTVTSCIFENLDRKDLKSYDIEYLFLKIRAKSVGEKSTLLFNCKDCNTENKVVINIDEIEIDVKKINNIIKISNEISVEMKHPTFESISKNKKIVNESPTQQVFGFIQESISAVLTENERFDMKDATDQEFQEFIESMTQDQFSKIREYIENIPKLSHKVNYACTNCKKENDVTLEGLQSFL